MTSRRMPLLVHVARGIGRLLPATVLAFRDRRPNVSCHPASCWRPKACLRPGVWRISWGEFVGLSPFSRAAPPPAWWGTGCTRPVWGPSSLGSSATVALSRTRVSTCRAPRWRCPSAALRPLWWHLELAHWKSRSMWLGPTTGPPRPRAALGEKISRCPSSPSLMS